MHSVYKIAIIMMMSLYFYPVIIGESESTISLDPKVVVGVEQTVEQCTVGGWFRPLEKIRVSFVKRYKKNLNYYLLNSILGTTPLGTKTILQCGANIEYESEKGYTPLMLAIIYNKVEHIKVLLNEGASLSDEQIQKTSMLKALTESDLEELDSYRERALKYLDQEKEIVLRNDGNNSQEDRPAKILINDDPIQLSTKEALLSTYTNYKSTLTFDQNHSDLLLSSILSLPNKGLDFVEVEEMDDEFCIFSNEEKRKQFMEKEFDIFNYSCGSSKDKVFNMYSKYFDLSHFSDVKKRFVVKSAGNFYRKLTVDDYREFVEEHKFHSSDKLRFKSLSEYFITVASLNNKGEFFVESDNNKTYGSNYGNLITFAIKGAQDINVPLLDANLDRKDIHHNWGGTSYAAPLVSGLLARILNYLPKKRAMKFPKFIKDLILRNSKPAPYLKGKVQYPVLIQPIKTLNYMRNTMFFEYVWDETKKKILIKCDKRMASYSIGNEKVNCNGSWNFLKISDDKMNLKIVTKKGYKTSSDQCILDYDKKSQRNLFKNYGRGKYPFHGILSCETDFKK